MKRTADLFDTELAERRRDIGIERAREHAERKSADWRDRAARLIRTFAAGRTEPFLAEDVVQFALANGLPAPPDNRAWGAAIRRAKALGFIRSCGIGRAKSSNLSPKILWTSST